MLDLFVETVPLFQPERVVDHERHVDDGRERAEDRGEDHAPQHLAVRVPIQKFQHRG